MRGVLPGHGYHAEEDTAAASGAACDGSGCGHWEVATGGCRQGEQRDGRSDARHWSLVGMRWRVPLVGGAVQGGFAEGLSRIRGTEISEA